MSFPAPGQEQTTPVMPPAPVERSASPWFSRGLGWLFGVWGAGVAALLVILQFTTTDPVGRAIARMALGLVVIWVVGGGALSLLLRRPARRWLQRYARHWRVAFVVGATAIALLEEAVTTTMTE